MKVKLSLVLTVILFCTPILAYGDESDYEDYEDGLTRNANPSGISNSPETDVQREERLLQLAMKDKSDCEKSLAEMRLGCEKHITGQEEDLESLKSAEEKLQEVQTAKDLEIQALQENFQKLLEENTLLQEKVAQLKMENELESENDLDFLNPR